MTMHTVHDPVKEEEEQRKCNNFLMVVMVFFCMLCGSFVATVNLMVKPKSESMVLKLSAITFIHTCISAIFGANICNLVAADKEIVEDDVIHNMKIAEEEEIWSDRKFIILWWFMIGLTTFVLYGSCTYSLYAVVKYNPEHMLSVTGLISLVNFTVAAFLGVVVSVRVQSSIMKSEASSVKGIDAVKS